MKKDIIVFDVDGTLCESSKELLLHHAVILNKLKEKYDISVCGGGTLNKILKQMNNKILFDHYFSECGCVYDKNCGCVYDKNTNMEDKLELSNIYKKNIREHKLYNKINLLVKESLKFFSNVEYTLTGQFVDLRCGIIYISCIGIQANDEEREYFKLLNKNEIIRKSLLESLLKKASELDITNDVTISYGGTVGIAIYPNEYDKIQVLSILENKYDNIFYFGDKYEQYGNDHKIVNSNNVKGFKIDNVLETYNILVNKFINN